MERAAATVIDTDVLVLGAGFSGVWCARRAAQRLTGASAVTIISAENYFVFQPLLPEVVGGGIEPGHVISPLRHLLRNVQIVRGEIRSIHREDRTVEVAVPDFDRPLRFKGRHTVLALGSIVDVTRIPGMAEHAFFMKNLADALALRHALIERLERAVLVHDPGKRTALLTFVVVGGGFSGVETAAEVLDLLRQARRFYPALREDPLRVVCIHSGERLMPELDARLGEFARRSLAARGLDIRTLARVRAVSNEGVHLQDGTFIPSRTVVCTIGNAPHPVVRMLELPATGGRVLTDEFLRVQGQEAVWAVGDCAQCPDGYGAVAPPTAQFAVRQGERAADNIVRALRHQPLQAFSHKSQGQLATLGHHNAVALIGGMRISGFFAWWLWRTIYLLKLPRVARKLQVMIDWTLGLVFPRDLAFVGMRGTMSLGRAHLEAGEELFHEGDPSTSFYVIESGRIELSRNNARGEQELCEVLGPGEHFGEGSLLRSRVRRATARALEPSSVLVLGAGAFDALTRDWGALRNMLENSSRRFSRQEDILPRGVPQDVLERSCGELMTTPVLCLPADASIEDALRVFTESSIGFLPLLDGARHIVGVATRSDLYRALHRDLELDQRLDTLCTRAVHAVRTTDRVAAAVELLRRRGLKHVPVVDQDGAIEGVISFRDVLREALGARAGDAPAHGAGTKRGGGGA